MNKKIKVTFRGNETYEFDEGTTYKEISESFKNTFNYDILVAKVNNNIVDLSETLTKKCNIDFYDRTSRLGNKVYRRSARFMLILAVKNILGEDAKVIAEYSVSEGAYFSLINATITKEKLEQIYNEMIKIAEDNYIFTKISVSRLDAINYFKKLNRLDKVNVLKYISNTYVNLYRINDYYDYFYDKMAYSTNQIKDFKLVYMSENEFIMCLPDTKNPNIVPEYIHHKKMFEKAYEYMKWCRTIGIENAFDLNRVISQAQIKELINLSEVYYNSQLTRIADEIWNNKKGVKIVLIAGPSSSGKTTTAKKLNIYLRSKGFVTHSIELDNYFIDIDKRPLDEDGKPDFESVRALDSELFNQNLSDLLEGKKVNMPTFNFGTRKREYKGNTLQLGDNDIIIVEGLHALNDELTKTIPSDKKYKIYISPMIQMNIDDHTYIHTTTLRKLRRIVRDSRTRGHAAVETLRMWPDVQKGEEKNVFKFQDEADSIVNTSLVYEIGVLKTYVEPLLFNVSEDEPEYPSALRLINFLRNFLPIPSDDVPSDSVLREFIGGSCFNDWKEGI